MARKKRAGKGGTKGKKAARKPAKKSGGRKASKAAAGPAPVKTGRGATVAEIGADFVRMFNARAGDEAIWAKWWNPRCESIEGSETQMVWKGLKQIRAKSAWWNEDHAVRGGSIGGPYVGATGFAIHYTVEVETKSTGKVEKMTEVGVYTVQNGKVVREEFMGLASAGAEAGAPDALEKAAAQM